MTYTEADFDRLSWHDCHIWAVEVRVGDPDEGDWTSDLALDVDFIVDWLCDPGGGCGRFRVAPANLIFHGVTEPRIKIDCGRSSYSVALHPLSISHVARELIHHQKVYLDRPYYEWSIQLNWPAGGEIVFGAAGFTQTLRAEPVVIERQYLSLKERGRRW
jgi:hypothetical protein